MSKGLHIGYFADGPWAHEAFKKIMADQTMQLDFICVRYDNRDQVLCEEAQKNNIELLCVPNINEESFLQKMEMQRPDLFVSMSFNQIFRSEMIHLPTYGTINCHAGKLPYYRGRNILNWVLINDEKEFGITVHYVDEGIDTGDIILQETFPITDEDDYGTLLERAYSGCAELLYRAIKQIQEGTAQRKKQDEIDPVGMYCGQRLLGDEIIDWNQSSRRVVNFIRALTRPAVGATSYIKGKEIKLYKAALVDGAKPYINIPGLVVGKDESAIYIKTDDTIIKVTDYQYDGTIRVGQRLENKSEIQTKKEGKS